MINLKGNIQKVFNLKSETSSEYKLNGKVKNIYNLFGRVESFLRSLTIRFFIQPIVNIYTYAYVDRYLKASINGQSNIYSRFMIIRNFKNNNIIAKSNITISASATKNIKIKIEGSPMFGAKTTLDLMDGFTLDELDSFTLEELEFTEGISVDVIKDVKINIIGIVNIEAVVYTAKLNKLSQFDDLILNELDDLTLNELDETLN